jgi:hypothetical protein
LERNRNRLVICADAHKVVHLAFPVASAVSHVRASPGLTRGDYDDGYYKPDNDAAVSHTDKS